MNKLETKRTNPTYKAHYLSTILILYNNLINLQFE